MFSSTCVLILDLTASARTETVEEGVFLILYCSSTLIIIVKMITMMSSTRLHTFNQMQSINATKRSRESLSHSSFLCLLTKIHRSLHFYVCKRTGFSKETTCSISFIFDTLLIHSSARTSEWKKNFFFLSFSSSSWVTNNETTPLFFLLFKDSMIFDFPIKCSLIIHHFFLGVLTMNAGVFL